MHSHEVKQACGTELQQCQTDASQVTCLQNTFALRIQADKFLQETGKDVLTYVAKSEQKDRVSSSGCVTSWQICKCLLCFGKSTSVFPRCITRGNESGAAAAATATAL